MREIAAKDLRRVLDLVHAVHENTTSTVLPQQVLAGVASLVGCDSACYVRLDPATEQVTILADEPFGGDIGRRPEFAQVVREHPVLHAYQAGLIARNTSVALSDLADRHQLSRLRLYQDFQRPARIAEQLFSVVVTGRSHSTALAFHRGRRGVRARDRSLADLFSRHLAHAERQRDRVGRLTAALRTLTRHDEGLARARPLLDDLTARERDVVEHLAAGLTDREIAGSLGISPRTAGKHLQSIYAKLGVVNRASLIAAIHRQR
ncbi:helix-turn-helix transcriptional regulator [Lentzea aerocolonigenes]|uniref:helix-turn-helix transcriptional regulator n=1 Tax=Lentzea aerocolonigenes TaxID=68170 RepID=UPI00068BDE62|nr:helix-turn-helix transcriptional regulator [Lentzea aerocolonigenes]MCP2248055.1 regulatory protein, luxR family [Lentzea aerocolonigenes]